MIKILHCFTFVILVYSFFTSPASARLYINEILSSNESVNMDPDFFDFSDWIEIYNDSSDAVDLSNFYLSDNHNNYKKWPIPPNTVVPEKGYIVFWTDAMDSALHTNFKLSTFGEIVVLTDSNNAVVDSITFPAQWANISFGRNPNTPSKWCYFDFPSPGSANYKKGLPSTTKFAASPQFSSPGGFYTNTIDLSLSGTHLHDSIRFTTDGSEPDTNSPLFQSSIHISGNTVIRAKIFSDSLFNSPTITHSYFINTSHQFPVISLSINPPYLWDDTYGIYIVGTNGSIGLEGDTGNYNQKWQRPINVEFFTADQKPEFNEAGNVKIAGLVSRSSALKGVLLSLNNEVAISLFSSKKIATVKDFVLRNSGGYDLYFTHFRDGMMNNLVANQMDIDFQAYQPAVVYMNGAYWGILNIREKIDANYPHLNYNEPPDKIDFVEYFSEPLLIAGDFDHYNNLTQYLSNNNIQNNEQYRYISSQIDINEFINYQISELYFCNTDWPGNNVKMWRPKSNNGRWRWIISDVETGFNLIEETGPEQNNFARILSPVETDAWNSPWSTLLFRKLIDNPTFKQKFCQTFALIVSTTFDSTRVVNQIDSTQKMLMPEFPSHINQWFQPPSMEAWDQNVEVLRNFARKRPLFCIEYLKEHFALPSTSPVSFIVKNSNQGTIVVNDVALPSDTSNVTLFNKIPFSIKAIPATGFQFAGWRGNLNSKVDSLAHFINGKSLIIAEFTSNHRSLLPPVLSSDMHLTSDQSPYYANQDIVVDSNVTLSIGPGVTICLGDSVSFYVNGSLRFIGDDKNPIILKPDSTSGTKNWGALCLKNTTSPSHLSYVRLERASCGRLNSEENLASLTTRQSEIYLDHVFIDSFKHPFFAYNGNSRINACSFRSHATCDILHIKLGTAIIENCDLQGSYAYDTDCIDFDGCIGGIIRGNTIHDLLASNSDGIDLGEKSKNILIEENLIFNCYDKGISIGQETNAIIERNTILNCNMGVGIKDSGSSATLDRNTFHGNNFGIECYEKNLGKGGGKAEIKNCIFSDCKQAPISVDAFSSIHISYSMSTTLPLPGEHNFTGSPFFKSSKTGNFNLMSFSPCINRGDPSSPFDPDYSVADIGAHYVPSQIAVNEISYGNKGTSVTGDWIELVNSSNDSVDLGDWSLSSRTNNWKTIIAPHQTMPPHSFFIVPGNRELFLSTFFNVSALTTSQSYTLDSLGETLILTNNSGNIIDSVAYANSSPWPHLSRSENQTLSLRNTVSDNARPDSWYTSSQPGTPGLPNTLKVPIDAIVINEINYRSSPFFNTEDWIELYNKSSTSVNVSGWVLTDNNPTRQFIFPPATTLASHEYMVICDNHEAFNLFYPNNWNTIGNLPLDFGRNGNDIKLFNGEGLLVDSLSFGTSSPWPASTIGSGPTIELINPILENSLPEAWSASTGFGTPGKLNSAFVYLSDTSLISDSSWMHTRLFQNFPNPFKGSSTITYILGPGENGIVDLSIFNFKGQLVKNLVHEKQHFGRYRIQLNMTSAASGTYIYRLASSTYSKAITMFLVR